MITLIVGGDVYTPDSVGRTNVLIAGDRIAQIGDFDSGALRQARIDHEVIDASGCVVIPGLIDVHEHLIGGSGEEGFATQTPEIHLSELLRAGITTVVGCLGTDTATRTMPALLAKAKGLKDEGLTAYVWTGGYTIPPATLTGNPLRDMLFVDEVFGAGETAISDRRSSAPSLPELARVVRQCYVGGTLTGKAGVTHFHVGDEESRLQPIRSLLDDYGVQPGSVYPTHVTRNEPLLREAIEITKRGVTVDMDTVDLDLARWLPYFLENGGVPEHLTVSSDAAINSPGSLWQQVRECIQSGVCDLPAGLSLVTRNPARMLKLNKGEIARGRDADILILRQQSLELRDVIARGRRLYGEGEPLTTERYLRNSNRTIELYGQKR